MLPASAVRWYWAHTTQFTQVYSGTVSPVVACEPGHYPLSAAFYCPVLSVQVVKTMVTNFGSVGKKLRESDLYYPRL